MTKNKLKIEELLVNKEEKTSAEDAEVKTSFESWAKDISTALLGSTGIAYACGFLINNLSLNKYGIYDFSIVNSRYIYTGFLFLLICALSLASSLQITKILDDPEKTAISKFAGFSLRWLVSSSFLSWSFRLLLTALEGWQKALEFPILVCFHFAILFFSTQVYFQKRSSFKKSASSYPLLPALLSSFPSLIFLAIIYSLVCYPGLPISLAGGRPEPIQFVVKSDDINLAEQVLKMQSGNISEIVYLLEQGSSSYYFLASNDQQSDSYHSVEIDKSFIAGIIHPLEVSLPPFILAEYKKVSSTPFLPTSSQVMPSPAIP